MAAASGRVECEIVGVGQDGGPSSYRWRRPALPDLRPMCFLFSIRLPLAVMLGVGACEAGAQEPPVAPPEDAASAPAEPVATPPDNTMGAISESIETTLDSWQEFLDELLLDA